MCFPMMELIVRDFLAAKLNVPVFLMEPEGDAPESYVLVEKTGSRSRNRVFRTTFAVQSDGGAFRGSGADGSALAAMTLNEQVKAAMDALPELDAVAASRLNSDYPYHDTERKRYRYQAVYDVTHY